MPVGKCGVRKTPLPRCLQLAARARAAAFATRPPLLLLLLRLPRCRCVRHAAAAFATLRSPRCRCDYCCHCCSLLLPTAACCHWMPPDQNQMIRQWDLQCARSGWLEAVTVNMSHNATKYWHVLLKNHQPSHPSSWCTLCSARVQHWRASYQSFSYADCRCVGFGANAALFGVLPKPVDLLLIGSYPR